jgi:hypothetical protein
MKKYRPKLLPEEIKLNSNNKYFSMIESDALYPQNFNNLSVS